jgi:hypothetical protein
MAARQGLLSAFKQGYNEVPRPISQYVLARSLAASVAESMTPPADARYVIFSCNADFYVNNYTTATVPGDVTDGTASEMNPSGYELNPAELPTISVISASACIITAAFYK